MSGGRRWELTYRGDLVHREALSHDPIRGTRSKTQDDASAGGLQPVALSWSVARRVEGGERSALAIDPTRDPAQLPLERRDVDLAPVLQQSVVRSLGDEDRVRERASVQLAEARGGPVEVADHCEHPARVTALQAPNLTAGTPEKSTARLGKRTGDLLDVAEAPMRAQVQRRAGAERADRDLFGPVTERILRAVVQRRSSQVVSCNAGDRLSSRAVATASEMLGLDDHELHRERHDRCEKERHAEVMLERHDRRGGRKTELSDGMGPVALVEVADQPREAAPAAHLSWAIVCRDTERGPSRIFAGARSCRVFRARTATSGALCPRR